MKPESPNVVVDLLFGDYPAVVDRKVVRAGSIYREGKSAGWKSRGDRRDRLRDYGGLENPGFVLSFVPATLIVNVPAGRYKCTLVCGDTDFENHQTVVSIEGSEAEIPLIRGRRFEFVTTEFGVESRDGQLRFSFDSPNNNWIINRLLLEPVDGEVPTTQRISYPDRWPAFNASNPAFSRLHDMAQRLSMDGRPSVPTGTTRADYADGVRGIVNFFRTYQASNGAILDPNKNKEFQYSTPAYAYCSSLLLAEGLEPGLRDSAIRAIDWAVSSFAKGQAATKHEDFFPFFIGQALRLIEPHVDAAQLDQWKKLLRNTNPFRIYRHKIGGRNGPGSNWNCKALAGEYLFYAAGIRDNLDFVEISLSMQGRFFDNPYGLYQEGPSVYDIFPRCWLGEMLHRGYAGRYADELSRALKLGEVSSLYLQMPNGALYSGGRSSHHLWGDALQVLCFEAAGRRLIDDPANYPLAGVFKRAARRAYAAVEDCRHPTGEFSVVRNRAPYTEQHGYERYSSHSQYNLLLGAILGLAYEAAETTEALEERSTPAENGHYLLELPPPFNRIIANCGGTAVNIAMAPGPGQFPMGLQVAELCGSAFETSLLDGVLHDSAFRIPDGPSASLATGLSWREGDQWLSLASVPKRFSRAVLTAKKLEEDVIAFGIEYRDHDDQALIIENYEIRPGEIQIDYSSSPVIQHHETRIQWNLLESDGQQAIDLVPDGNAVHALKNGTGLTYQMPIGSWLCVAPERFGTRNGFSRTIIGKGSALRLQIREF